MEKVIVESIANIDTSSPEITYTGPPAQRDSRELMSVISSYVRTQGKVLDLGCGHRGTH